MSELFKIVTFQDGKYIANKEKLFDTFHCLAHQEEDRNTISDIADKSLNCFLRNANEAFTSKLQFWINDDRIEDKEALFNWLSTNGSPRFQAEMLPRFNKIFPDSFNETKKK